MRSRSPDKSGHYNLYHHEPPREIGFPHRLLYTADMPNNLPLETFILIPGRTSRQGTTLNEGKFTAAYVEEIGTLLMNGDDMARLALKNGDRVRLQSEQGQIELPCQAAKAGELPPGLLFLPYGDLSSRLMGGDTHGSGMPNSKGIDVELEKI
jgi:formylmethanofuran dehydrogenase subunit D